MTAILTDAAATLAEVLEQENDALLALDLPRAVSLLERKHRATDALQAARSAGVALADRAAAQLLATRLDALAAENKRLLERAIDVQRQVIATIARAAPRRVPQAPRYNAAGSLAGAAFVAPLALSARA